MYNLLSVAADKYRTPPVGEAALYALLGFLVVFVGIAFLILVVWAVGKIMTKTEKAKKTKEASKQKAESVAKPSEVNAVEEISEETVAAITAAIMAYYQQEQKKCEFTVKRIKKV